MMFSGETDTDIMWSHNGAYVKLNSDEVGYLIDILYLESDFKLYNKFDNKLFRKLDKAYKFFKEMEGKRDKS